MFVLPITKKAVFTAPFKLPTGNFFQCCANIGQRTNGFHARIFKCCKLLVSSTFTTSDDCTSMTHALTSRCSNTSNVRNNRLGYIRFDVSGGFFFSATTNLTDHNNRFGCWIVLEHFQYVDKASAWDGVATNTYTSRLAETVIGRLLNRFIG